jgi:hypothetical protein
MNQLHFAITPALLGRSRGWPESAAAASEGAGEYVCIDPCFLPASLVHRQTDRRLKPELPLRNAII